MKIQSVATAVVIAVLSAVIGGSVVRASKAPAAPAAPMSVAFVDMKRAIDATDDGKRVTAELLTDLDAKNKELAEAKAALFKAEKTEKQAPLADRRAKVEQLRIRLQGEYNAKEKALATPLAARMSKVIESLSVSKHVVIFSTAVTPYLPPGTDLTDEAIKASAGAGVAAAPASAAEVAAMRAELDELRKRRQ